MFYETFKPYLPWDATCLLGCIFIFEEQGVIMEYTVKGWRGVVLYICTLLSMQMSMPGIMWHWNYVKLRYEFIYASAMSMWDFIIQVSTSKGVYICHIPQIYLIHSMMPGQIGCLRLVEWMNHSWDTYHSMNKFVRCSYSAHISLHRIYWSLIFKSIHFNLVDRIRKRRPYKNLKML